MDQRIKEVQAWRIKEGRREEILDPVVVEAPLTIYFNERELVTLLCTPEHLDELAVGFLYSEGLLGSREDFGSVLVDAGKGLVWVSGKEKALAGQTFLKRYITTGCGKGTSFYSFHDTNSRSVTGGLQVPAGDLLALMRKVQQSSELFARTGGVHSAALCTTGGIVIFRDDIGRHNAADKIIGRCLLDGVPMDDKIFITSGRISSEILLKTAKAGIPVLVSRSAPTALAIEIAGQVGVTVAGFARGSRLNIYTHPQRITD
ncbi:MAG: formate dehydrogenase accessory sulfurtransferase FdhD [Bacillota bacterium]